jgi:hypothetical protein
MVAAEMAAEVLEEVEADEVVEVADCGIAFDAAALVDDAETEEEGGSGNEEAAPRLTVSLGAGTGAVAVQSVTAHGNMRANLLRRTATAPAHGKEDVDGNAAMSVPIFRVSLALAMELPVLPPPLVTLEPALPPPPLLTLLPWLTLLPPLF